MNLSNTVLRDFASKLGLPHKVVEQAQLRADVLYLEKNEHLVRAGEKTDRVAILQKGLLRKYRLLKDGSDITTEIVFTGGLAAPYSDQIQNIPATLGIEALEPSSMVVFSFAALRSLSKKNSEWMRVAMDVAEKLFLEKEHREIMLSLSAREKLQSFMAQHPVSWEKVPKHVVASYLGINPSTLSRLLKSTSGSALNK